MMSSNSPISKNAIEMMLSYHYDTQATTGNKRAMHLEFDPVIIQVVRVSREKVSYDGDGPNPFFYERLVLHLTDLDLCVPAIIDRQYQEEALRKRRSGQHNRETVNPVQKELKVNVLLCIREFRFHLTDDDHHYLILESFNIVSPSESFDSIVQPHSPPKSVNKCRQNEMLVSYLMVSHEYTSIDRTCFWLFGGNKLGYAGAVAVAKEIPTNIPLLRRLNLRGNSFGNNGIQHLVESLRAIPTLELIDLSDNRISDHGVRYVVTLLKQTPNLCTLRLISNNIGDQGAQYLASVLLNDVATLEDLYLGGNNISRRGIQALATMLTKNRSLKNIALDRNRIDSDGIIELAIALRQNRTLEGLCISYNPLTNDGILFLAKELRYNIRLVELNVQQSYLSVDAKLALYKALEYNTSLEHLVLEDTSPFENSLITFREDTEYAPGSIIFEAVWNMVVNYNDTLRVLKDQKLPKYLQVLMSELSVDASHNPECKGQHQKHDSLQWLKQNVDLWM